MKRVLTAIAVCLLLCGCGAMEAEETTVPAPVQEAVQPTEPAGSYLPGSSIEYSTNGAVRAYARNPKDIYTIEAVGEDLLVFSGEETTVITRLTGENLFRVAEVQLDLALSPDDPGMYLDENRLVYYDDRSRELVFLNQDLREITRMNGPEDMLGKPVLDGEGNLLYYCTASGVRCLEMEAGISRLVKEMHFADQCVEEVLMGGSVLRVNVADADGNREILFLDARSGALVGGLPMDITLTTGEDYFYAVDPEGIVNQMLFGTGEQTWLLTPKDYRDSGVFLPESHAAVIYVPTESGMSLDYYDLETGMRKASLNLGQMQPVELTGDKRGYLYFLDENQNIYRWDVSETPVEEETVYIGPRYTLAEPDETGLDQCRDLANDLSQRHGLEIVIAEEAVGVKPFDYDLVPEYQVPVLREALARLETMLAHFPAGFFETAVSDMQDGKITVCLVRDLIGSPESGIQNTADGTQFWVGNQSYVVLAMGDRMEQTFYHQMFHALETRVLSESIAFYRWDELNPRGFDYDYDYTVNESRDGSQYLEEKSRSFIDTYSMSFPKEDRARVMEYACMEGNESWFISYTMQRKLRTLCEGIREAYKLEDSPEVFLWEQYLESPLAPQG